MHFFSFKGRTLSSQALCGVFAFLKDIDTLCSARSDLTVLQKCSERFITTLFFKRDHVFASSLVGKRGSTAMGGYSTLITVRRDHKARNLKRGTCFICINI